MNNSTQHSKPPSQKQLDHLKSLAEKTGRSFDWPTTSRQASEAIKTLQKAPTTPAADRRREVHQVKNDLARQSGGAVRIGADELSGFGSAASWGHRSLPTEKQLDLLERLSRERDVEFVMPKTKGEASRMIDEFLAPSS